MDKQITCKDCGNNFTFTENEQDFFKQKGFNDPVRCSDCRKKRKANKEASGYGRKPNYQGRTY